MPRLTAEDRLGKTHRLVDIVTEEISIVDRPANRRRFLLRKGSEGVVQGSALVDLETTPDEPEPSEAGRELVAAFESVLAAAKKFEAEPDARAVIDSATLEEVGDIAARLCSATSGSKPGTEPMMTDSQKTEKGRGKNAAVLHEVAQRALRLVSRVQNGVDRKVVNEVKRIGALLQDIIGRYPAPQAKSETEQATLSDAAVAGDLEALSQVFESTDYESAQSALSELDGAVSAAEARIAESEKPPEPEDEAPAAPAAAPEPTPAVSPEVQALQAKIAEQDKVIAEMRAELKKALETPQDRASRGDPPADDGKGDSDAWDPDDFPMNFNDPVHREKLRKAGRDD